MEGEKMKTVSDIMKEIRFRNDVEHIADEEILEYINDIELQLVESLFPIFHSLSVELTGSESYKVSSEIPDPRKIVAVYVDGRKLLRKRDSYDLIDGWYYSVGSVFLSELFREGKKMIVVHKAPMKPHVLDEMDTDTDLLIPAPYHDLYVYYALSQIAAKEADEASYKNYKEDYNSLLSEALAVTTKRQLFPNYTL